MALVKSAAEILAGRPRPVDPVKPGPGKGRGGRPPLHRGCKLAHKGCDRPHHGNGYCRPHNRAWGLYGDPEAIYKRPPKCTCQACPVHQPQNVAWQRQPRRKTAHSG